MNASSKPTQSSPNQQFSQVLDQMTRVIREERSALRVLDAAGIERATQQKLELAQRLIGIADNSILAASDIDSLKRLQDDLRTNHVLLAHARKCVRGVIDAASGQPSASYPAGRSVASTSMRVNLRG